MTAPVKPAFRFLTGTDTDPRREWAVTVGLTDVGRPEVLAYVEPGSLDDCRATRGVQALLVAVADVVLHGPPGMVPSAVEVTFPGGNLVMPLDWCDRDLPELTAEYPGRRVRLLRIRELSRPDAAPVLLW